MEEELKKEIKNRLKDSIRNFFRGKEVKAKHVLDTIFPVERRIRSLIGGLETSLGTTVWEPIAKAFATNNGFQIHDPSKFLRIRNEPDSIVTLRNNWVRKRQEGDGGVSVTGFIDALKIELDKIAEYNFDFAPMDSGDNIDVWIEKDGVEYAFDIKTTQPNANAGNSFNEKLIRWYTYRTIQDRDKEFHAFFGIPFNPYTTKPFWNGAGGRLFPLVLNEDVFVEDNFWSVLTDIQNPWENIEALFIELGNEEFGKEFNDILYKNRTSL